MKNLTPLFHLVDVAFNSVQLNCFCCSHSVFPVFAVMRIKKMWLAPGQAWQQILYKHILMLTLSSCVLGPTYSGWNHTTVHFYPFYFGTPAFINNKR